MRIEFTGSRVGITGKTNDESGYAEVRITDKEGKEIFSTYVDFYCHDIDVPDSNPGKRMLTEGVRWMSPVLAYGDYTLTVKCSDMKPNWTDK